MNPNEKLQLLSALGFALFALSEVLAYIPKVKANSLFQLLQTLLEKIYKK